jgi:uncharacterized protein YcbK (DUF882 family)
MLKNNYIVDYITEKEIKCKCRKCEQDPSNSLIKFEQPQLDFFQKISDVRRMRGVPIIIVSGYRCYENPESSRNPNSAHCQGLAIDFYEQGIPIHETYRFYERAMSWNGIGVNQKGGTLHLDDKPHRFGRWSYRQGVKAGKKYYKPEYMILFNI